MSPRRANPELAERRREALQRAGYAEVLERGIEATTLDSVVARADSSKGGLSIISGPKKISSSASWSGCCAR
jgi:AcrR family transcriptional regulator